jgi:outer membrane lipoprotein-sorting protein
MKILRTASTRRLTGALAGALAVIAAGTAIAVAAAGSGPVPKPASLADAIHTALSGRQVAGISADITFTNHLISVPNLGQSDPLLQGASGRLWYAPGTGRLRLELQSGNGDAQIVVNDGSFWVSDPSSSTVYEGTLPHGAHGGRAAAGSDAARAHDAADQAPPSIAQIQAEIGKLAQHLLLGGALPSDVAGNPTYTVRVAPKHDGGLLGAAQLAFAAANGIPLDLAVYAAGNSSPVLELQASNVSFGAVSPGVFAISPPAGDKVVRIDTGNAHVGGQPGAKPMTGYAEVASSLPFTLAAPATAAGLPRQNVVKLDWGGKPGALVTYGQGIGGIAVIERPASPASNPTAPMPAGQGQGQGQGGGGPSGLDLPTVSIAGTSAHELDTALGTVIMFDRHGVSCTVLGSVPPTAAEAAATDIAKAL